MTARLIFICHASTDAVRQSAFPADEPLDGIGKREAFGLAGSVPRADRICSSPELRARQTAQMLGLSAAVEPALRDCDYGRWSGQSFDDVSAREPDAVATWLRDTAAAPHGGESLLAFMQRVATWLGGELIQHRQSIVITHAAVIRAATVHAIEATPQSFWRIDVAPLSCTRLSGNNGRWNLVSTGCSMSGGK
jgi:broad specificity phosphatase PhoE